MTPHRKSAAEDAPIWRDLSAVLSGVIAALSLVGVALFALLASAYEEYYRAFDLSLDDVGLGYAQLLYDSAGVLGGGAVALGALSGLAVMVVPRAWLQRVKRAGRRAVGGLACVVLGAILGIAIWLTNEAHARGQAAIYGQAVRPLEILYAPVLNVRADRATVSWIDRSKRSAPFPPLLLYIARSASTYTLYDPESGAILSVPVSEVRLQVISQHV